MKRILISLLLLAGCAGQSPAKPINRVDCQAILATLAIIDADGATYTPSLPVDDFKRAAEDGDAVGDATIAEPDNRPLIYFYVSDNCPHCRRLERDVAGCKDFRFVKAAPDAWAAAQTDGYPHLRWQIDGKWVAAQHGWGDLDQFRMVYAASQKPRKPLKFARDLRPGRRFAS